MNNNRGSQTSPIVYNYLENTKILPRPEITTKTQDFTGRKRYEFNAQRRKGCGVNLSGI